jgi:importin subunit beta-1
LELPLGKWSNLIPILAHNCFNENINFRVASIETLGYICEELTNKTMQASEVDQILTALITNISDVNVSEDILIISLKGLLNIIPLAGKNFASQVYFFINL